MISVNTRELRSRLKHYLDLLENGEEVIVIRNSQIIGRMVPEGVAPPASKDDKQHTLRDHRKVTFRTFGAYEDPEPIRQLHQLALESAGTYIQDPSRDFDLNAPGSSYAKLGGEFWIGEMDGELVAMGGFRFHQSGGAELKRMRVRPDLHGQGIGSALLEILEAKAKAHGYEAVYLDTVVGTTAQNFYERHGYYETYRQKGDQLELVFYKKEL